MENPRELNEELLPKPYATAMSMMLVNCIIHTASASKEYFIMVEQKETTYQDHQKSLGLWQNVPLNIVVSALIGFLVYSDAHDVSTNPKPS